ncbi:MAG: hypothetical protein RMM58_06700 [Chloroflexota bacterium]|nr:hypothetical protein [Dehalococcoidia bacterium]MDW8253550.1 hypothetical protein [Chloroflexota bacterium]
MKREATLRGAAGAVGPVIVALAAAGAAASPLLQPGYYEGHDGVAHLFRVAILAEEIGRGVLYPRWAADLALGYGYPVFHFYGPLAHYAAWAVSRAGVALPEAVKVVYALLFFLSALGAFALAREVAPTAGRWGAAVAGAAYALAPYLLADVYVRGAFGEAVSLAAYPPLLWGVHRLARGSSRRAWLATAASTAFAVATYNPLALVGLPLAGAFALWCGGWRGLCRAGLGLALGLGLAAWFWLPALVDQRVVTIGNLNYARENFLALGQLVQMSWQYRHEQFPFAIGLVQAAAAGAGTLGMLRLRGRERRVALFFPLAALTVAVSISAPAAPLWEALPLLSLIAYPWRLLAFVGLLGAVASAGGVLLVPPLARPVAAGVSILLLAVTSVTETLPEPIPLLAEEVTTAGWQRREHQLGRIGTTTGAEYLPLWSARGPGAASDVPRSVGAPTIESARLETVAGLDLSLTVTSTQPTVLRLHSFLFPGWTARVNGAPAAVRPETALGLVTVDLPAGRSQVEFRFVETPIVVVGSVVTTVSFLLLAVALLWPCRRLAGAAAGAVILLALAIFGYRPLPVAPQGGGQELAPGLWLLGATAALNGEEIAARLYWLATRPPERDHRLVLALRDERGAIVAERAGPARYGLEPTSEWRANEIIPDPVWFRLPASRPAGRYTLTVSLDDGPPVAVAAAQLPAATTATPPPPVAVFGGQLALEAATVRVAGRSPAEGPAAPGDELVLETQWRAVRSPDDDYVFFVHLYAMDGRRWWQSDSRIGGGVSAPTTWQAGDKRVDRRRGILPLDLPAGVYRVEGGWYEPGGGPRLETSSGSTVVLAQVAVVRPVAPPAHRLEVPFGEWARLEGWDVDRQGGELRLVWQAVRPPTGRYHVFVHGLDETGQILGQSDGPPAAGAFPTDAWPIGALIEDRRPLPPHRGTLRLGLYDPHTGQRLATRGGDSIVIRP